MHNPQFYVFGKRLMDNNYTFICLNAPSHYLSQCWPYCHLKYVAPTAPLIILLVRSETIPSVRQHSSVLFNIVTSITNDMSKIMSKNVGKNFTSLVILPLFDFKSSQANAMLVKSCENWGLGVTGYIPLELTFMITSVIFKSIFKSRLKCNRWNDGFDELVIPW